MNLKGGDASCVQRFNVENAFNTMGFFLPGLAANVVSEKAEWTKIEDAKTSGITEEKTINKIIDPDKAQHEEVNFEQAS